jgi:hypothetical protein
MCEHCVCTYCVSKEKKKSSIYILNKVKRLDVNSSVHLIYKKSSVHLVLVQP